MAGHRFSKTQMNNSLMEWFGSQTIYVLPLCLVICLLLVVHRSKGHASPSDAERGTSRLSAKEQGQDLDPAPAVQKNPDSEPTYLYPYPYSTFAAQQARLPDRVDSRYDVMSSTPFTTGSVYLAAKAETQTGDKAEPEPEHAHAYAPHRSDDVLAESPSLRRKMTREENDQEDHTDQQACYRRASYPQAEGQRGGALHRDSKHDETETFLHHHDPDVVWRRRTMIFLAGA
ncbi:hypothetical protein A1O3_10182 [Capronia epimyces CBS 606.96]|uniref:Uncharacterized protein n=1 Tax=Capronia epimyces CBS 606.96 TaxID=1182542 RepID=W9XI51_9EURO|nr:uncharacterized protein A1O3_10182 [Capronia epimyces CBS 606.96]EXJ77025.1 hypothetical protein A1O3_10182 [Capronia epimyces CBS 606.96]